MVVFTPLPFALLLIYYFTKKFVRYPIWKITISIINDVGFSLVPIKLHKRISIFVIDLLQLKCADNEDFYNLLAQIITFQHLPQVWKEKKLGVTIGYENTFEPPLILWDVQAYKRSLSRINIENGFTSCIKRQGVNSQQSHQSQVREGTFFIGGLGGGGIRGILEIFLRKKSWPSHFPEWINAWPFTNTYTKTSDPPPTSSKTKLTGSENN